MNPPLTRDDIRGRLSGTASGGILVLPMRTHFLAAANIAAASLESSGRRPLIRAAYLVCLALILTAPGTLPALAADPAPNVPPQSRLPRTISFASLSMFSRARLLVLDATREEIKLSDVQARQVDDLLREWSANEEGSNRRPASPPEQNPARNANRAEGDQNYLERLQALLTAEQNSHLNRLLLQSEGLGVFSRRDPLTERMDFDAEQRRQIGVINRDVRASGESRMARFLDILTPAQRAIWDELAGKDFVLSDRAQGRGRGVSLQIPGLRRPMSLLRQDWARRDLKLTGEQAAKIDALFAALDAGQLDLQEQVVAGAQGEARQRRLQQLQKSTDQIHEDLLAEISASQRERLDQLALQSDSLVAFRSLDVRNALDLNRQQAMAIDGLLGEFTDFATETPMEDEAKWLEEIGLKKDQLLNSALLLLTPEQREKWNTLVGPPADRATLSRP